MLNHKIALLISIHDACAYDAAWHVVQKFTNTEYSPVRCGRLCKEAIRGADVHRLQLLTVDCLQL